MEFDRPAFHRPLWSNTSVSCPWTASCYIADSLAQTAKHTIFLSSVPMLFSLERCAHCCRHGNLPKLTFAALKGSDHLDFLVDSRLFRPVSTPDMESIYSTPPNLSKSFTFVTRTQVLEGVDPEESMLLQPGAHKLVAKNLEVPELAAEVERAVRQVKQSLQRQIEQERQQIDAREKQNDSTRK